MSILETLKARKSTFVLLALGLGVGGYEWHQAKTASLVATAQAKPAEDQKRGVFAEGRVAAYPGAEVTLSAELAGRLEKLLVSERDHVEKGQRIAEIDVKTQRAALSEAWARVKEADTDIGYFAREKARDEKLFAQNVVAAAALDKTAHDADSAGRRRASLVATAARLGAELDKAAIVSPIGGTITARYADAGEFVNAGAPLVTVTDLEKLRIEAEVGEFDTGRVRLGANVDIRAEGFEGKPWKGVVEEIPDQVVTRQQKPLDPSRPTDTRVMVVKIRLTGPVPLKLGQRVEVEIARAP
jgi:RND family efflux transporter MFP subunit